MGSSFYCLSRPKKAATSSLHHSIHNSLPKPTRSKKPSRMPRTQLKLCVIRVRKSFVSYPPPSRIAHEPSEVRETLAKQRLCTPPSWRQTRRLGQWSIAGTSTCAQAHAPEAGNSTRHLPSAWHSISKGQLVRYQTISCTILACFSRTGTSNSISPPACRTNGGADVSRRILTSLPMANQPWPRSVIFAAAARK